MANKTNKRNKTIKNKTIKNTANKRNKTVKRGGNFNKEQIYIIKEILRDKDFTKKEIKAFMEKINVIAQRYASKEDDLYEHLENSSKPHIKSWINQQYDYQIDKLDTDNEDSDED